MRTRFAIVGAILAALFPALAARADRAKNFEVVRFVTAEKVGFDGRGVCYAKKAARQVYYFKNFPASLEHMESCVTLSSKSARGRVSFNMSVVDKEDDSLLDLDGYMDFGQRGKVSQILEWEKLEVLRPGRYQIVLTVDDEEVGRWPIRFEKAGR
ncbi:MAG: hypothetical protein GYA21_00050 [Myxococcales bacterium]|nr:hypothetical protein [Myxococcales bacterium]